MSKILALLVSRGLWQAIAVLIGSGLIWLVGPWIAVGDRHPLQTVAVRQLVIALWAGWWLWRGYRPFVARRLMHRRLRRSLYELPGEPAGDRLASEALRSGFEHAVRLLRRWPERPGSGIAGRWRHGRRQQRYRLPWYLVLGATGCGKDKALQHAGVEWYAGPARLNASTAGQAEHHCQWYFSKQGVLLSPSGSIAEGNQVLWDSLLGWLKRYRPAQPLNGVILAISAQGLLHKSPAELLRQASRLRQRLLELRQQSGQPLPVYIMVTKSDRLAGFSAFFNRYEGADLDQAWGITLPWPAPTGDQWVQQLSDHCDRLQHGLDAVLTEVMLGENDERQRARIFCFPQAFAGLRPRLLSYLFEVFAHHEGDLPLSPRGLWFTSANQKIGRICSAGMQPASELFDYYAELDEGEPPTDPRAAAQSYFIKGLLERVIFADYACAGRSRWQQWRQRLVTSCGWLIIFAVLATSAGLCLLSYQHNSQSFVQVQASVVPLRQLSLDVMHGDDKDVAVILPLLNALAALGQTATPSPALDHRMGLYRGGVIQAAGERVYQQTLHHLLLPLVAQTLTALLWRAEDDETDFGYQALKAYQMLYQPAHYDGAFLHDWLTANMAELPGAADLDAHQRRQFSRHLQALLVGEPVHSPYQLNSALLTHKQQVLRQRAVSQRVYNRLKKALLNQRRFKQVSLVDLAGAQADMVLERKSGRPVTEAVSGFFTPQGYWQGLDRQMSAVIAELQQEDRWVLDLATQQDQHELASSVRQRYMDDFILQWDGFLNDITLVESLDRQQRLHSLRILSSERSPLRLLVMRLSPLLALQDEQAEDPLDTLGRRVNGSASQIMARLFAAHHTDGNDQTAETIVRQHYRDLIDLARPLSDASDAGIRFDESVKPLGDLYRYLSSLQQGDIPAGDNAIINQLQADAHRLPLPLRDVLLALVNDARGQTQRQALGRLRHLADSGIGAFCRAAIGGRYPLVPHSAQDISPDDLARLFAPDTGLTDRFFAQHLADKVNTRGQLWRFFPWIQGGQEKESGAVLAFFRQARQVTEAFFRRGSQTPGFSFSIRPIAMDHRILSLTLDIDGQQLNYHHGPRSARHLYWPGEGRSGKASLSVILADERRHTIETHGPWALNRLMDAGQPQATGDGLSRHITYTLQGHSVTLAFTADSIINPFTLPVFTCLASPESDET